MNYSRLFGSNFPNEIIEVGTKKDIDDYNKIIEYYNLIDSGNINEAIELYKSSNLESYSITASDYNRWQEELYNLGIAIFNNSSIIHGDNEPLTQTINSHWLIEY